jgi:hypothetical protein
LLRCMETFDADDAATNSVFTIFPLDGGINMVSEKLVP